MGRAKTEEIKNVLENTRVEVRFVPRRNSRITNPKHIMYGDMSEDAKVKLSVPLLRSGEFVNVLTNDEKAFFENEFGLDEGAMSVYKTKDNYWDDSNNVGVSSVLLTKRSTFLDLSNPVDYIKYKILLANKDIVAPSLQELNDNYKATYQFVLVKESDEQQIQKTKLNSTMEAFTQLGRIMDDYDTLKFVVETLVRMPFASDTKIDVLQTKAQECIQNNAKDFLAVVKDENLPAKILIKKGVANGVIITKGGYYYLNDGNVPLCGKNQEPTLDVASNYIMLPKNQELKFLIEAKVKA